MYESVASDKNFWMQGYTLISRDAEDCVPVFLKHIANDVYVCGKTINLLKICCPQVHLKHFIMLLLKTLGSIKAGTYQADVRPLANVRPTVSNGRG